MVNIPARTLIHSIILAMGSLTFGYVMGYTSPALPQLRKEFPDTQELLFTLFNSAHALFALFGPFIARGLVSPSLKFGRRWSTVIFAIAGICFWALVLGSGKSLWIGIVARAGLGVTIGGFSALVPMYIVELSPPDATGFFGTIPQIFVALGIVVTNMVGAGVSWRWNAVIGGIVDVVLLFGMFAVPESPAVEQQATAIQIDEQTESVLSAKWAHALAVSCCFTIFQQFTAVNAIVANLASLFKQAGVELKAEWASAIATSAQVIACLVAGFLIEALGRRLMWAISFGAITVADFAYGLCRYPSFADKVASVIPIVILFIHLFAFGLGAGPIPWFIVSEMFPTVVRASANSIAASCNWLFAFIVLLAFPSMQESLGTWGSFLFFAAVSLAGTLFGLFFVSKAQPTDETEHKEIWDELASR
jgi:MFS family permease